MEGQDKEPNETNRFKVVAWSQEWRKKQLLNQRINNMVNSMLCFFFSQAETEPYKILLVKGN